MISAKMDLLMKKLEDRANEKQEAMHIHDSRITCQDCGNTRHSGNNCPKTQEDVFTPKFGRRTWELKASKSVSIKESIA